MTFSDDAGEYTVFAKNQLGEVSASSMLLDEGWSYMCVYMFTNGHIQRALFQDAISHKTVMKQRVGSVNSRMVYQAHLGKELFIYIC